MKVYLVEISTDIYGFPDEQRVFSSEKVAENFVLWAHKHHPSKDHRNFGVSLDDLEVEDSF